MSRPGIEPGSQELASCAITARPPQYVTARPRHRAFDVFQGSFYTCGDAFVKLAKVISAKKFLPGAHARGQFLRKCPQAHRCVPGYLTSNKWGLARGRLLMICPAPRPNAWRETNRLWSLFGFMGQHATTVSHFLLQFWESAPLQKSFLCHFSWWLLIMLQNCSGGSCFSWHLKS